MKRRALLLLLLLVLSGCTEVTTQAFAGLSRALEHQVEVERVFADIIVEP